MDRIWIYNSIWPIKGKTKQTSRAPSKTQITLIPKKPELVCYNETKQKLIPGRLAYDETQQNDDKLKEAYQIK